MRKVADQWLRDVLLVLYRKRNVTRAEIGEETALNPASISHTLRFLLDRGTVLKVGDLQSGGGRKREVFNLNPEAGYFVAADLEGARIRFALTGLSGDIRLRWEADGELPSPFDPGRFFAGIEKVLRSVDARERSRVLAIGISYPGLLDEKGLLTAANLGLEKFPLLEALETEARRHGLGDIPIFLEQDRHGVMVAERWLGQAKAHQNGLLLFADRGIGIGIFVDGKAIQGWHNMAGEIGHMTIDPASGEPCRCGKRGCLETLASSSHILRRYLESDARNGGHAAGVRITDVFEKARHQDPAAAAVVEEAGKALGLALSHAINLLNPSIVILVGDLVSGEDVLLPVIREEVRRHTLPDLFAGLEIAVSGLGLDTRLKGAAAAAFRRSLADPLLLKTLCGPALQREAGAAFSNRAASRRKSSRTDRLVVVE